MLDYIKSLFQLILSPGRGWEDIARAKYDPRRLATSCLYKLIAVAAVSVFCQWLWEPDMTFIRLLMLAIITFVMFFAGYFIGIFGLSIIMPHFSAGSVVDNKIHIFVNYSIGLLVLIQLFNNLMPINVPLIYFLPLYVAVVQWKGSAYMQVPESYAGRFVLLAAPLVILPPYLIKGFFNFILPS